MRCPIFDFNFVIISLNLFEVNKFSILTFKRSASNIFTVIKFKRTYHANRTIGTHTIYPRATLFAYNCFIMNNASITDTNIN